MYNKEKRESKKKERDQQKQGRVVPVHIDPDKDQTDPRPFKEKPSKLAMLVDPKSLDDLENIGGLDGLLSGLGVDGAKGLFMRSEEGHTVDSGQEVGSNSKSGAQWKASMGERRKIYGRNDLPARKSKSLLLLMWLAFKDKVLVSPYPIFTFALIRPRYCCPSLPLCPSL